MRKTNLKLVHSVKSKAESAAVSPRPFETDYAGMWRGHCKTRESAIQVAIKNVVHGHSKCTITDITTGETIARISTTNRRRQVIIDVIKPLLKLPGE